MPGPGLIDVDPKLIERVNRAISEIQRGRMVVLVDDEDRENEGDLCMAAEFTTAEAVNFMAMHGRGLICLTLSEEQIDRLHLPMMRAPGRSGPSLGTAFTVSIEARLGVTTGISAADRAHTIQVAARPDCVPEDLVTPGHVFPLKARNGGVLVRTGQTEGSVDLARLAGLTPAGVICEIMNDDGSMARMPDLEAFSKKHGLLILTIADLIQYRLQTERLVRRVGEQTITLDQTGTEWRCLVYETATDRRQIVALVKGEPDKSDKEESVLCRMHAGSTLGDTFASTPWEGGRNLRESLHRIECEGRGVVVYIPPRGNVLVELKTYATHQHAPPAHGTTPTPGPVVPPPTAAGSSPRVAEGPQDPPLREYGLGAQVLFDLGLHKIRLLTNNPRKIAGIRGYGLEIVGSLPLTEPSETPSE